LTDEPGSASLYFNQNGYTADAKEMVKLKTARPGVKVLFTSGYADEIGDDCQRSGLPAEAFQSEELKAKVREALANPVDS